MFTISLILKILIALIICGSFGSNFITCCFPVFSSCSLRISSDSIEKLLSIALNNDFNLSTHESTSVLQLAKVIWEILKPDEEFRYICDESYEYDVQKRVPNTSKAEKVLGFKAQISLKESVEEVIKYMRNKNE